MRLYVICLHCEVGDTEQRIYLFKDYSCQVGSEMKVVKRTSSILLQSSKKQHQQSGAKHKYFNYEQGVFTFILFTVSLNNILLSVLLVSVT